MPGSLAHSPADVVRRLLIALGLGTDPDLATLAAWPVYASGEPDLPDSAITVYDTAGRDSGRAMVGGERFEIHGIMVRIRAARHSAGYAKARSVAVGMDEMYQDHVMVGASRYLVWQISRTGDVLSLGTESPTSKRRLFTVNALAQLRQVS